MDHEPHEPRAQDAAAQARRLRASIASLTSLRDRAEEFRAYFVAHPSTFSAKSVRAAEERLRDLEERLRQRRRELAALTRRDRCGARCRDGHACGAPANGRGGRCKLHGGRSTGPRTAEGRERSLAALQRARAARIATPGTA